MITDCTKVLVNITNLSLYCIDGMLHQDTTIEAIKTRYEKEAKEKALKFKEYADLYPSKEFYWLECSKQEESAKFKIMSYKEFKEKQKEKYLNPAPKEITEDKFFEMLEILPPKNWIIINGVEEFCMSEHETANFTMQYAKFKGKFYSKCVDVFDRSTWLHNFIGG